MIRRVWLRTPDDIVAARQVSREMARELGFGSGDQTRLATAVSELARNAIQHAHEGVCIVTDESTPNAAKIQVVVEDHGPGIVDLEAALTPGFSTDRGLGAGLPSAKMLVHAFQVQSEPGHTAVTVMMVRNRI